MKHSKILATLFAASSALAGGMSVHAQSSGGWSQGSIGRIYAGQFKTPHVFFVVYDYQLRPGFQSPDTLQASHHNAPACSTADGEWSLDTSTLGGQQAYQLLLQNSTAAGGWGVRVVGTGACTTWPDREDVLYIYTDRVSPPLSGS